MGHSLVVVVLLISSVFRIQALGSDTLKPGESLSQNQTLVSANGVVEMGFFSPGEDGYTYLGIWFRQDKLKKPVWVANRDNALQSPSGTLTFNSSGNLVLTDAKSTYIVVNEDKPASSNGTIARILDSGNLVLLLGEDTIWQSFDYPTDTFLPGMRLGWLMPTGGNQVQTHLVTWSSPSTPTSGLYTIGLDVDTKTGFGVWRRGIRQRILGFWNGTEFNFFLTKVINDQVFTFVTNSTHVLLSFNTSGNYTAVWYSFASNGDINQYKLSNSGITTTNYPLCDPSAYPPSTADCVNVLSNCKVGDEFVERIGALQNYRTLQLGLSDCAITCKTNCSCTAYASLSDECQLYYGAIRSLDNAIVTGNDTIYMRKGSGNGSDKTASKLWWIIVISVIMFIIFVALGCFLWRKFNSRGKYLSFKASNRSRGESTLDLAGNNDQELPLLSFASLASATDNFSMMNKLGEGGFGAVYKGKLSGYEIAVKRLSKCSKQGTDEFKTEVQLISKLQHRNLVKLLGCCIHDDERMLVYEYMPNKSLDTFIFGSKQENSLLSWGQRLDIIKGIAQGLLYLHKYSRLKVIHRDLKTSNILLDSDMNPKIADFGMARIFWENESQAETMRIAGTYGYMAPEYAIRGIFSAKSDVFSFGVILLEIVSGRKNTSHCEGGFIYLLSQAWDLWTAERSEELLDPRIAETCPKKEARLCIQLGLLCIQDNPDDRPSMSDVIFILSNEDATLPDPKQPALFFKSKFSDVNTSRKTSSFNDVTFSDMEGR